MGEFASKGVAGTGLGLGIAGTALGVLAGGANGILGNVLGGNRGGVPAGGFGGGWNCAESALYQNAISAKDAEIGQLKAERYADSVGIGVYQNAINLSNRNDEKINANLEKSYTELINTRERIVKNEMEFQCAQKDISRISAQVAALDAEAANQRVLQQKTEDAINCLANSTNERFGAVYAAINCAKRECADAITLEAERRCAGDNSIMQYVNATFVAGKLVMPRSSICPEVMPRYNTWTAPTTEAPDTTSISGNINVTGNTGYTRCNAE
jgi:hypothetical protein